MSLNSRREAGKKEGEGDTCKMQGGGEHTIKKICLMHAGVDDKNLKVHN